MYLIFALTLIASWLASAGILLLGVSKLHAAIVGNQFLAQPKTLFDRIASRFLGLSKHFLRIVVMAVDRQGNLKVPASTRHGLTQVKTNRLGYIMGYEGISSFRGMLSAHILWPTNTFGRSAVLGWSKSGFRLGPIRVLGWSKNRFRRAENAV